MGQIKNIKLHIVTDIKRIKSKKDEGQVEEEKGAKAEKKKKKDERKIKVNNQLLWEGNNNKQEMEESWNFGITQWKILKHPSMLKAATQLLIHDQLQQVVMKFPEVECFFVCCVSILTFLLKYILMV